MSLWGQMSHEAGQRLADSLSAYRPFVGTTVRIVEGRKHVGKVGRVVWHGVDRFRGRQYGDSYVQAATEVMGRHGYRVGVDVDGERFFVPADYTMVCVDRQA
jgi:hypothetical protein